METPGTELLYAARVDLYKSGQDSPGIRVEEICD